MEHHLTNEVFKFDANRRLDRQEMLEAKQKDDAQNKFIDSVFNTKQAAEEVYKAVDKLLIQRYCLEKGKKIKPKALVVCQETSRKIKGLLDTLKQCAETFSFESLYPIENMRGCYEAAVDTCIASIQLENVLSEFQASLKNETADESIKLLGKVKKEHLQLCSAVDLFPAMHKKNHQLEAIQQSVRNITLENS